MKDYEDFNECVLELYIVMVKMLGFGVQNEKDSNSDST